MLFFFFVDTSARGTRLRSLFGRSTVVTRVRPTLLALEVDDGGWNIDHSTGQSPEIRRVPLFFTVDLETKNPFVRLGLGGLTNVNNG